MTEQIKRALLERGITRTMAGYDPLLSMVERYVDAPYLYKQSIKEVAKEMNISEHALRQRIRNISLRYERMDPEGYRSVMEDGPYRMRLLVRALAKDTERMLQSEQG
ncbi:MAG: hypothetical protein HFF50_10095 [Lawsonibacter sp.]|nr:hypothetical protein [Lawsonibacter sp.]